MHSLHPISPTTRDGESRKAITPAYRVLFAFSMSVVALSPIRHAQAQDSNPGTPPTRPNFVWIMSEDNSKHYLRHFDSDGAPAPNVEAMASHGITFDRAFSCAPVCSVARTTLITACYAPRIGTQFHRRSKAASLPAGLEMFPTFLKRAGYYTTNNNKEDYNAVAERPWDMSSKQASWKNRPTTSTSFFHVVTFGDSHESSLHVDLSLSKHKTETDPEQVRLQPYFPDTPLFRQTRARYHDRMQMIDGHVGDVIEELRQAGELENTFVFYFGDHGGVLPRSKGYLYESGLHVPLVIRVPDRFQELAKRELGSRTEGFVEFVDFGPTVLHLAGVKVPENVDGTPFLGAGVNSAEVDSRSEALGYADRFDEKYELVRSLRQGNWKYHRNFEAFLPDGLHNNYRYLMPAYQQWRELAQAGQLNPVQMAFFEPKAVESLFDLSTDPHETMNLASDPAFRDVLARLRERLTERLKAMPDLSFFPEAVLYEEAMPDPVAFGKKNANRIAEFIDTANLALELFGVVRLPLRDALKSEDPWQRYWATIVCGCFGKAAASLEDDLRRRCADEEPLVSARAAESLALVSGLDPRATLYRAIKEANSEPEALQTMNVAVFVDGLESGKWRIDPAQIHFGFTPAKNSELGGRMDYLKR